MGKAKKIVIGGALISAVALASSIGLRGCSTQEIPQGTRKVVAYEKGVESLPREVYTKKEIPRQGEETYIGSHTVRKSERLVDIVVREYKLDPCKDGKKIADLAAAIVRENPKAFAEDSDTVGAEGVKPCDKEHKAPYGGTSTDGADGIPGDVMYATVGGKPTALKLPGMTRPKTGTDFTYVEVDNVSKLPSGTELYAMKEGKPFVYRVKAGDRVWNLVADLCGTDPCNSSAMRDEINRTVGASSDVFGSASDTMGYKGVEPCEGGKRPAGAEKVDGPDGISGDKLPAVKGGKPVELKIPCKKTDPTYEKVGEVKEEALPPVRKSRWQLWREKYWDSWSVGGVWDSVWSSDETETAPEAAPGGGSYLDRSSDDARAYAEFDAGDTSLLEYVGMNKSGRFDRKLAQKAGAFDRLKTDIGNAYRTMNAKQVKAYLADMGVEMSETTIRNLARADLGAEYDSIAGARSRANLRRGYKDGAAVNHRDVLPYVTGIAA